MRNVFGKNLSDVISHALLKNDYDEILTHADNINRIAKKRAFFKHPLKSTYGILYFLSEKAWRMIVCPSSVQKTIAVEAPDGAGKTTFIDKLTLEIAHYFVSDISKSQIYHFRPELFPNLGAAGEKVGIMKQDKNFTTPHRAKPVSTLSSFLRMAYYWLDYVVGVPLILRKNAQFDKITIFDRYIYDFLVDPRRTRISLPFWLRRLFTRLVKQPKIVFVLDTDAETIFNRKQELTKDEINRQLSEFRKLASLGSKVHFLDASKTPDEISNDAIKIVIETFTNKLV